MCTNTLMTMILLNYTVYLINFEYRRNPTTIKKISFICHCEYHQGIMKQLVLKTQKHKNSDKNSDNLLAILVLITITVDYYCY